jgi:hypothetical protein
LFQCADVLRFLRMVNDFTRSEIVTRAQDAGKPVGTSFLNVHFPFFKQGNHDRLYSGR